MQNQPKKGPIGHQGQPGINGGPVLPILAQGGAHPPLNPATGDIWIDQFGDVHVWGGCYWVKSAGARDGSSEDGAVLIGVYNNHKVYYGQVPPSHGDNIYWILADRRVFESVNKRFATSASLNGMPGEVWEQVLDQPLLVHIQEFVNHLFEEVSPIVEILPNKCSPAEAEDKLQAFEKIIEPAGRLDSPSPMQGLLSQLKEINLKPHKYKALRQEDIIKMINEIIGITKP